MKISRTLYGFLTAVLITSLIPAGVTFAAAGGYVINIDSNVVTGYQLDISGTASADPYVGQMNQQFVTVDWDGPLINNIPTELATTNFTIGSNTTFSGTWNASHIYTASGEYTVTVRVHHQNSQGAEGSPLSVKIIDVVIPPTGTLNVIKHVVNDNGGTLTAGDFTMSVTGTGVSTP